LLEEANVMKLPCQLTRLRFTIALAASAIFVAGVADTALAQTSPELDFLNDSLAKRANHGDRQTRKECDQEFNSDVETASATVFVLLSGDQKATNVKFKPEVPAAGSKVPKAGRSGLSPKDFSELIAQNQLFVQAEAAKNGQPDHSIKPSKVKAFDLTFFICSKSKAPNWGSYFWNTTIPVEWSSFAGQLVVRDSANAQIAPGTVALQLVRPAPGYDAVSFTVILGIALTCWVVLLVVMFLLIVVANGFSPLNKDLAFDFKTVLIIPSTATAAVLGTLVTTTILPSDTLFMPKGQYAALNVLFGLIAVLAGIVYNNYRKAWIFLIGAGVALGAGGGEAVAILFVLKEMALQGSLPAGSAIIVQIAIAVVWLLITILAAVKVVKEINKPGRLAAEYPLA
jgi:hypothetical protein